MSVRALNLHVSTRNPWPKFDIQFSPKHLSINHNLVIKWIMRSILLKILSLELVLFEYSHALSLYYIYIFQFFLDL